MVPRRFLPFAEGRGAIRPAVGNCGEIMVNKKCLFYLVILPLVLKMMLIDGLSVMFTGEHLFAPIHAEVDFFSSSPQSSAKPKSSEYGSQLRERANVIFFIAPGCRACPEEALRLEKELKRLGVDYEIEGVFLGDPSKVGAYIAELRSYPFNFELGVDLDGSITREFGVRTFPAAVVEMGGKRVIVTKAVELEGKLKARR